MWGSDDIFPTSQRAVHERCFHASGNWVPIGREVLDRSIPELFERSVVRHADRLAIKHGPVEWTYGELNQAANRIAHAIVNRIGADNDAVAVYLDLGPQLIAAMLGAMKAGKILLAVDPADLPSRSAHVIATVQPRLMVIDYHGLAHMQPELWPRGEMLNVDDLDARAAPGDLALSMPAYAVARINVTSGSTGAPKAILGTHRHFVHWYWSYGHAVHVCMDDRIWRNVASDTNNTLFALLSGASVHFYNLASEGVSSFADWLMRERVTMLRTVPGVLRSMVAAMASDGIFPDLRVVSLMGDTVYRDHLDLFRRHFSPHCVLVNCLGSQESSDYRIFFMDHSTQLAENLVPAGYPLPDKESFLVDDDGDTVAPGEVGEIVVKSRYLSRGYLGRPELTAAKFRLSEEPDQESLYFTGDMGRISEDGCLYHLGRKDHQVKIRGLRVDIFEVEEVLRSLDGVGEAAVAASADHTGERRLVAYIVPSGAAAPTVSVLRGALARVAPKHMVPTSYVMMDALPRTQNGKVNRKALPTPGRARPNLDNAFAPPATPVETMLAALWAEVLGLEKVGIHDSFLDLGGHSLLAGQLISRVLVQFQVSVPLSQLLAAPTIADMATAILHYQLDRLEPDELDRLLAELDVQQAAAQGEANPI